ncbi:GTPase-activating protein S13 [Malassezia vespertilionis]|uniref:GTPase-activating protein S13 n=1 Tax=Malassezia vespertilionis TaxID=2020962 RepID=UPI0024B0A883|nr:GTPase-activating protein S13 [Malassezia vespertilionis]WFD07606.1 GTPase-activating protein S13 [Malassezia vespertilionis]
MATVQPFGGSDGVKSHTKTVETFHEDAVHDAQLDFYGSQLATCSSDRTVKVFEVQGGTATGPGETLVGHEGPVWQVAWAHPSFGTILASAAYDGKVFIWKHESSGVQQTYGAPPSNWVRIKDHALHTASVNAIAWAPHELGATLACASSDGKVSVLTFNMDGSWSGDIVTAHPAGCNAVSWAPAVVATEDAAETAPLVRRFASAGCDAVVKIWEFSDEQNRYMEVDQLLGHTDWVRDVAFAPNLGLARLYLATASQDRTVFIWSQDGQGAPWTKTALQPKSNPADPSKFPDTVWRVSWSVSGNVLAVSCGDGKISLWKENLKGAWECISDLDA